MTTGFLILFNLLTQSGDVVFEVLQLSLYLLHTVHPGLALGSCGLADAAGWTKTSVSEKYRSTGAWKWKWTGTKVKVRSYLCLRSFNLEDNWDLSFSRFLRSALYLWTVTWRTKSLKHRNTQVNVMLDGWQKSQLHSDWIDCFCVSVWTWHSVTLTSLDFRLSFCFWTLAFSSVLLGWSTWTCCVIPSNRSWICLCLSSASVTFFCVITWKQRQTEVKGLSKHTHT